MRPESIQLLSCSKGVTMICLCRHRGEAKVQLQPICNLELGQGWSAPHSGHFSPTIDTVPIAQEAGWSSRQAWTAWKISPCEDSIPRPSSTQPNAILCCSGCPLAEVQGHYINCQLSFLIPCCYCTASVDSWLIGA
jgi:hypothetical protein